MEIKDTLLTPKTSFAMKADLANREPKFQESWQNEQIFRKLTEKNNDKPQFILIDGPPYANGNLHTGHALNKILKDFVNRYKSMTGYKVDFILGWDTHGLPIENALLKQKGFKIEEYTVAEFRQKCQEFAEKQITIQKEQFMRLGILADPNQTYQTYNKEYEAAQIRIFAKMAMSGLIYKGLKPVYWSPSSQSALADAEIEYQNKISNSIYVKFEIASGEFTGVNVVIWTTTPWTLPANQAVSLNEEEEYSIVSANDCDYLVASKLVEDFAATTKLELTLKQTLSARELAGVSLKHPIFTEKLVPIIFGEHVTTDSGTGCVHTAPGHGEDDYLVGLKNNLEVVSVVNHRGIMTDEAGMFAGEFYEKANEPIIEYLRTNGALVYHTTFEHSYPHDWRTKKPVIYRATEQWFASIDKIKNEILTEIEGVNWINEWGAVRLSNMMKDRVDWCISRQRKWGVPIPIIYTANMEPIIDEAVFEKIAQIFEEHGTNIWFEQPAEFFLTENYPDAEYVKEMDIMDVWFDSGSAHTAVGQTRLGSAVADLYLEGSDQYRGWFNSSLITSVAAHGQAPYKTVLSHGFVLDGKGNKMSKSLGNTVDPLTIIQKYGADILRLWVASVDYQSDVRISDEIVKQVAEVYRRLRNTFRFMLGNLNDYDQTKFEIKSLPEVDQFILGRLSEISIECVEAFEAFEFKKVAEKINVFFTHELSAFYFDFIKDIIYIVKADDERRRQIQFVISEILNTLVTILTPILPHTMDEIYQELKTEDKIFMQEIQKYNVDVAPEIMTRYFAFMEVRHELNKALEDARANGIIGKTLEAKLTLELNDEIKSLFAQIPDLETLLMVSKIEFAQVENMQLLKIGAVAVTKYTDTRCERCWRYFEEEQLSAESLCETCSTVIAELKA
ncbi:MAG: isoleucine--tRNA ligase [Mycoplasmatales bacterium]